MRQTFSKDERLRKRVLIEKLYQEGKSQYLYPFRVRWLTVSHPGSMPVQLLISVPKHDLRKAVQRNLVKRRIREAYRKNKFILYDFLGSRGLQMIVGITYCQKEIVPYSLIEDKIIVFLQRLTDEYAKNSG